MKRMITGKYKHNCSNLCIEVETGQHCTALKNRSMWKWIISHCSGAGLSCCAVLLSIVVLYTTKNCINNNINNNQISIVPCGSNFRDAVWSSMEKTCVF